MDEKDLSPTHQNQADGMRTKLATFASENRRTLQITGLVAAAGITGAVGGALAFKGVVASKGGAAAKAALLAKGATAFKGATSSLPAILSPQGAGTLASLSAKPGIASVMASQTSGLVGTLSGNALPLAAVLASGGLIGTALTRGHAFSIQDQLNAQVATTEMAQAEKAQIQRILTATQAELHSLQATFNASPTIPLAEQLPTILAHQRLERIYGIGRAYAQRLRAAGIYTIADLAEQTPEALSDILEKRRAGGTFQPEAWLNEAQQLISQQEGNGAQNESQKVIAASAMPLTAQVVVPSSLAVDRMAVDRVEADRVEADRAKLETVMLAFDRLEAIEGISPAMAARLNRSGILTYGDLAGQESAQIITILPDEPPLTAQAIKSWIRIANELADQ